MFLASIFLNVYVLMNRCQSFLVCQKSCSNHLLNILDVFQADRVSAEEQVDSTFLPQPTTTTDTNHLQQSWVHIMNLDRNAVAKAYGYHHRAVVEAPGWWNPSGSGDTINDNDGSPSTREDVSPRIVRDAFWVGRTPADPIIPHVFRNRKSKSTRCHLFECR